MKSPWTARRRRSALGRLSCRRLVPVLLLTACIGNAGLEEARRRHDAHARHLEQEFLGRTDVLRQTVLDALDVMIEERKAAGEPGPVSEARALKRRFLSDGYLPVPTRADPPVWRDTVADFGFRKRRNELERRRQLADLLDAYASETETKVAEWTRSGRIEQALDAQAEVVAVRELEKHTAPHPLETPQLEHDIALHRAQRAFEDALDIADDAYRIDLENRIEQARRETRPDLIQDLRRELRQLGLRIETPDPLPSGAQPPLRLARSDYLCRRQPAELAYLVARRTALEIHHDRIDTLARELVSEDRIEEASAVLAESARVRETADALRERIDGMPRTRKPLPAGLHASLRLHYGFDLDYADRVMDLSGNGFHATSRSAAWTASGRVEGALRFTDRASVVADALHGPVSGSGPFTVCAWIQTRDSNLQTIVQQRDSTSMHGEFQLFVDREGRLRYFEYEHGRFGFRCVSSRRVSDGKWHFVAFVRDPKVGRLYINAVEEDAQRGKPVALDPRRRFAVGVDYAGGDSVFAGTLDEVMVFDRALSARELFWLFHR